GRSHECDYPPEVRDLPALASQLITSSSPAEIDRQVSLALAGSGEGAAPEAGDAGSSQRSLYRLDEARLRSLAPDVILTQDLCDVCSIDLGTVREIARRLDRPPAIESLNPQTFEDTLD